MKFFPIVPILFLCTFFPMYTTAYTNQIAGDVMSTVIPYLTQFEEMISSFFPDIMPVADLYASVTNYTTYSCPLKWIVRTRGRYIFYYTEIQTRINDTRDTVLANYTYWSDRFMTLGDSLDADVTELLEILTENGCDSDFQTSFIDSLQQNITISINAINNLYQYYTMISPVSASLAYAFPNELIKALQRQSIMNFGDLGRAVHYAEFLRYHEDRRLYIEQLETIEWSLKGAHYKAFDSTMKAVISIVKDAMIRSIRFPCVM